MPGLTVSWTGNGTPPSVTGVEVAQGLIPVLVDISVNATRVRLDGVESK